MAQSQKKQRKPNVAEIRSIAKAIYGFGQMIVETGSELETSLNGHQAVYMPLTLVDGIGIFLMWGGERLLAELRENEDVRAEKV